MMCHAAAAAAARLLARALEHRSPRSIAIVSSSAAQARLTEHVCDLYLPVSAGVCEVRFWTPVSMAQVIRDQLCVSVGARNGPGGGYRSAELALFRSVIWSLPLSSFRPANSPDRFAEDVYRHFSNLRSMCIRPDTYSSFVRAMRDAQLGVAPDANTINVDSLKAARSMDPWFIAVHEELAAAYGAWCAACAQAHPRTASRESIVYEVVQALMHGTCDPAVADTGAKRLIPHPLGDVRLVIAAAQRHSSLFGPQSPLRTALTLLWHGTAFPPSDGSALEVQLYSQSSGTAQDASAWRAVLSRVCDAASTRHPKVRWHMPTLEPGITPLSNSPHSAPSALPLPASPPTDPIAIRDAARRILSSKWRVQVGIRKRSASAQDEHVVAVYTVGNGDELYRSIPDLVMQAADLCARTDAIPNLVVVACRRAAQAQQVAATLQLFQEKQSSDGAAPRNVAIVCDTERSLAMLPDVRHIMAFLHVVAGVDADQYLYHVCTTGSYALPPSTIGALLAEASAALPGTPRRSLRTVLRDAAQVITAPSDAETTAVSSVRLHDRDIIKRLLKDIEQSETVLARTGSLAAVVARCIRRLHTSQSPQRAVNESVLTQLARVCHDVEFGVDTSRGSGGPSSDVDDSETLNAFPPRGILHVLQALASALEEESLYDTIVMSSDGTTPDLDEALPGAALVQDASSRSELRRALRLLGSTVELPAAAAPTVMVCTTLRRATAMKAGVTILFDATDSALPGSFQNAPVPALPTAVVHGMAQHSGLPAAVAALVPTSPSTREEHIEQRRALFTAVVDNGAVASFMLVCDGVSSASSQRRPSRFVAEMLAAATEVQAAPAQLPHAASHPPVASQAPTVIPAPLSAVRSSQHSRTPSSLSLTPLSFTRISEYATCPHKFFLKRIMRIAPQPGVPLVYGAAMHAGVAAFSSQLYRALHPKYSAPTAVPTFAEAVSHSFRLVTSLSTNAAARAAAVEQLPRSDEASKRMLAAFEHAWVTGEPVLPDEPADTLRESLLGSIPRTAAPPELPAAQWRELHSTAQRYLKEFAERELSALQSQLAGQDASSVDVSVPALVEYPFDVMSPAGCAIRGVLDRVDVGVHAVQGPRIVLREFKSSVQWHRSQALSRSGNMRQLALYSAAISHLSRALPTGMVKQVRLESIELGEVAIVDIKTEREKEALQLVDDVAARVAAEDFAPTPSAFTCASCEVRHACPHAFQERVITG